MLQHEFSVCHPCLVHSVDTFKPNIFCFHFPTVFRTTKIRIFQRLVDADFIVFNRLRNSSYSRYCRMAMFDKKTPIWTFFIPKSNKITATYFRLQPQSLCNACFLCVGSTCTLSWILWFPQILLWEHKVDFDSSLFTLQTQNRSFYVITFS